MDFFSLSHDSYKVRLTGWWDTKKASDEHFRNLCSCSRNDYQSAIDAERRWSKRGPNVKSKSERTALTGVTAIDWGRTKESPGPRVVLEARYLQGVEWPSVFTTLRDKDF